MAYLLRKSSQNEIFEYKPKGYGLNLIGVLDSIFGGKARRQKKYNENQHKISKLLKELNQGNIPLE